MSNTTKTRSPRKIANEAKNTAQMVANVARLDAFGTSPAMGERPSKTLRNIARAGLEKNPDVRRANDTPRKLKANERKALLEKGQRK